MRLVNLLFVVYVILACISIYYIHTQAIVLPIKMPPIKSYYKTISGSKVVQLLEIFFILESVLAGYFLINKEKYRKYPLLVKLGLIFFGGMAGASLFIY